LSFLKGEFEVEPAFGEKREESLRIAGLKTYFITKVLKPVSMQLSHFFYPIVHGHSKTL
jgi:adenylate cyclase 3